MAKKSAVKQMEELFKKVEKLKEQFEVASQKALEEAEVLKQEIQEEETEVQELYTMYVLDQIVLEAYQEAKDKLDSKKKLLTVAEGKSADMEDLKKQELYKLYQQIKAIEGDYRKEDNKNVALHRKRIFQAKRDYLKFMHEVQKDMTTTYKYNSMISRLMVDLNMKDYNNQSYRPNVTNFFENTYNGTAGIEVTREEVLTAFDSGKVSFKLSQETK